MKFLMTFAAALLVPAVSFAGEPRYVVSNQCPPKFTVTNKSTPCTYCTSCSCAAGVCPSCPTTTDAGVLTTTDGRKLRPLGNGTYTYADDEPAKVLDCSSGKCRWVDAPAREIPAYLPPVTGSTPASYSAGTCTNGQCGSVSGVSRSSPRFAFPRK